MSNTSAQSGFKQLTYNKQKKRMLKQDKDEHGKERITDEELFSLLQYDRYSLLL